MKKKRTVFFSRSIPCVHGYIVAFSKEKNHNGIQSFAASLLAAGEPPLFSISTNVKIVLIFPDHSMY